MDNMTPEEWAENWREAGRVLERLRREELRKVDTAQALRNLSGMYESCRMHFAPRPDSGLVIQQDLFRRLKP